jgi:hypothetical protein
VRISRASFDRGSRPEPGPGEPSTARLVRLGDERAAVPDGCACCGARSAHARSLADRSGHHLLIGYCDDCAEHVARSATRRWSALAAGALLGATLAAGLPVAVPELPLASSALFAVAGVLLVPLAARAFERARRGHAAAGPAVFFRGRGELVCRRGAWADEFAERLGLESEPTKVPLEGLRPVLGVAFAMALAATFLHRFHHPLLRIVNLGEVTLETFIDGRAFGRVQPSSAESPGAGLELRVPAGRRRFEMRDLDGNLVDRVETRVASGRHHLYAPASPEICFWLETRGYGRDAAPEQYTPLEGSERFWVIPEQVRGWFSPNPPGDEAARATGGTSVVLRQGPCVEAPFAAESRARDEP